ncbi:Dynein Heavy Chain 11, Axonemal [Manis pentadactyla]|nr:Dynein Heavy Chain 11, Axonemal [Manis pentadactyla]
MGSETVKATRLEEQAGGGHRSILSTININIAELLPFSWTNVSSFSEEDVKTKEAKEKDIFPPNCIDVDTEVQNSSRKSPNDTVNSHDWNLDQRQSVMCYQKQEQFNSLLKLEIKLSTIPRSNLTD